MTTKWTSNSLPAGESGGSSPELHEQFVVLLLYGKNSFGDKIYSYLKIVLPNLPNLKSAIKSGNGFNPSDFGEVIAAGRGDPTDEVRAEIASLYEVFDAQQPDKTAAAAMPQEKKEWDEY